MGAATRRDDGRTEGADGHDGAQRTVFGSAPAEHLGGHGGIGDLEVHAEGAQHEHHEQHEHDVGAMPDVAGSSRTEPRPLRCGAGCSCAGFMANSAPIIARKLSALMSMPGATPTAAMSRPAAPGPISRAALKDIELRPTALGINESATISETKA